MRTETTNRQLQPARLLRVVCPDRVVRMVAGSSPLQPRCLFGDGAACYCTEVA